MEENWRKKKGRTSRIRKKMADGMGVPGGNEDEEYMIKEKMKGNENKRRMRKKGTLVPLGLRGLQFD